jgi:hypothetical protein
MSALVPSFKTHFFHPEGPVATRLAMLLVGAVIEGFLAGLIVWGIAAWIGRATHRGAETQL